LLPLTSAAALVARACIAAATRARAAAAVARADATRSRLASISPRWRLVGGGT
jgi:hypothetical protein